MSYDSVCTYIVNRRPLVVCLLEEGSKPSPVLYQNVSFMIPLLFIGDHVKSIFEKSGLPPSKLAQIW